MKRTKAENQIDVKEDLISTAEDCASGDEQFLESLAKECEKEVLEENNELRSVSPERKKRQKMLLKSSQIGEGII